MKACCRVIVSRWWCLQPCDAREQAGLTRKLGSGGNSSTRALTPHQCIEPRIVGSFTSTKHGADSIYHGEDHHHRQAKPLYTACPSRWLLSNLSACELARSFSSRACVAYRRSGLDSADGAMVRGTYRLWPEGLSLHLLWCCSPDNAKYHHGV